MVRRERGRADAAGSAGARSRPNPVEESFEEFYLATRADLLTSTFALTGDLSAARAGVREAYTSAWHHWRKVSHLDDPLDYVRPRAWRLAQRRHTARLGRRDKDVDAEAARVLAALAMLEWDQRRAVVLRHLSQVPMSRSARELGLPLAQAADLLQRGVAALCDELDARPDDLPALLARLQPSIRSAVLPRPPLIRRAGSKRRRSHTLIASAAAVVLTVAAGSLVHSPVAPGRVQADPPPPAPELAPRMLLTPEDFTDLDDGVPSAWEVETTGDNTRGDGLNLPCQAARFADPDGLAALVRRFAEVTRGAAAPRSVVQTVELSRTEDEAMQAFDTTLGWFAGCGLARLQLITTHRVLHAADDAYLLTLRVAERPVTTYTVAVGRTGRLTTAVVVTAPGERSVPVRRTAQLLSTALGDLCVSAAARVCAPVAAVERIPPLQAGEEPGLVAVVDLPAVGRIEEPWVGTSPAAASPNPATTTCDDTDFTEAGATSGRSRTFLIPEADLAPEFGVATSYGVFEGPRRASAVLDRAAARLDGCEDRDLASTVRRVAQDSGGRGARATEIRIWEVRTEISETEEVRFRTALVRAGNRVVQLTFTPTGRADLDDGDFQRLAERALERLAELR